jgi:glycosyltransferase involved in cell wall biosynthesis
MSKVRPDPVMTPISVIIPSRNEGGRIVRTVRSLATGRSRPFPLEVVVVDDASTDGSCDRLADAVGPALNVRLVVRRLPRWSGIPFARNRGAEAAAGPIFLITDANTTYPGNWDLPIRQHFHTSRLLAGTIVDEATGACGYGLTLDLPTMGVRWLPTADRFGGYVPVAACTCTVIDRQLFHQLGGYDETLPLYGAAEPEFSVRAWLSGCEVVSVPTLVVGHRFRPVRDRRRFETGNRLTLLRNYLRFACFYLPEDLLTKTIRFFACSAGAAADACLTELKTDGTWLRREQLRRGLPRTFRWFAQRFALDSV